MTWFILDWIAWGGYLGIILLMALENIIPPIPSEVIMGLGGMSVARGEMAMAPLVLVAGAGTTAGNYFWYWIGRRLGVDRLRPFVERHGRWQTLDWPGVQAIERFFARRATAEMAKAGTSYARGCALRYTSSRCAASTAV